MQKESIHYSLIKCNGCQIVLCFLTWSRRKDLGQSLESLTTFVTSANKQAHEIRESFSEIRRRDGWEGLLTTWHAPRMIDSSKLLILHIHCHCFTSWRERCCESLLCPWSKVRQNRNAVLDGWPHHEDINQIWLRQLVRPWPPFSSRMKMAKFYWLGGLCSQLPQQQP